MIVKDILDKITEDRKDYKLRMSCMTKEYTIQNPLSSNNGCLYNDGYTVCFEINWNGKGETFVKELFEYDGKQDVISWDDDDGNMINFESVIIDDINKLVILV